MNRNRQRCDSCDHIGPEVPGIQSDLRHLHRALHELGQVLLEPFVPLLTHVTARLSADVQRGTQDDPMEDQ